MVDTHILETPFLMYAIIGLVLQNLNILCQNYTTTSLSGIKMTIQEHLIEKCDCQSNAS